MKHNRWHPGIEPAFEVKAGGELTLECDDGFDGQLTRESTHEDAARLDLGLGHPLTGPVFVRGAEPGDVLEVEFVAYEPDDFGTTAVIPGFGFLADVFPQPYLVKWEIAEGLARSEELPGVTVPQDMFAGVAGVAPSPERLDQFRAREEALRAQGQAVAEPLPESALPPTAADGLRTIPPRETGGNLDIRQLVAGSRLWLPVDVPGALFSIGRSSLRAGRRRGVRDGDRGRRLGDGAAPRARGPGACVPGLRDAGRPGAALVRDDGYPGRCGDGPERRRPGRCWR